MKKFVAGILAAALAVSSAIFCVACDTGSKPDDGDTPPALQPEEPQLADALKTNLSADGYVKGKIGDFSAYENTDAYRKVKTAEELFKAVSDAKIHYKNVWDEASGTYTQVPADGYTEDNYKGTVRVIEIENDLNLGFDKLGGVNTYGVVEDFSRKQKPTIVSKFTMSDVYTENGISQIKVENTSDLLIYSKNGAKLTHCGFKVTSCNNVAFRNLEFDEIWQWEDASDPSTNAVGDYDAFGWAYFKVAFCGYVWIDHCTFGKSYDGQIDYSNPDYTANAGVAFRAPYGADGGNGLHISWCNFNGGSDDKDGYLYKMMKKIEDEYQAGGKNYLYYNALRAKGISFEEILYGLAIPQKKGFLCGDSGDPYEYNLKLQVSFSNCKFINLEDRLPKLRGGNSYMYNCIVDSSQYISYRSLLKGRNAAGIVMGVNSGWKCALVSQGIVCGNGGSFMGENCVYRGIESLLKNNDKNTADKVEGGYKLVNCSYLSGASGTPYVGSSSDSGNRFANSTPSTLKPENFSWHTEDGEQPFTIAATALDKLEESLADVKYGAGAKNGFSLSLLKSKY